MIIVRIAAIACLALTGLAVSVQAAEKPKTGDIHAPVKPSPESRSGTLKKGVIVAPVKPSPDKVRAGKKVP